MTNPQPTSIWKRQFLPQMKLRRLVQPLASWRVVRRCIFCLACFFTLLALCYAEENWRGKRSWNEYKAKMEAKGARFDRASFIPAPVPDDQNFAMTPFLAPLFDFIPGTQEHRDTNWDHGIKEFNALAVERRAKAPAQARMVRMNSWAAPADDVVWSISRPKANSVLWTNQSAGPAPNARELATNVLALLSQADPVLDELRTAIRRRYSRFSIRYENDDPAAILLPHLAVLKHACQILELRASAELALDRADDAFGDVELIFGLIEAIRDEPILISQLVRFAESQIAFEAISEGLAAHKWSDAHLLDLHRRLEQLDFCADGKRALDAERVLLGGGWMDYFRRLNSRQRLRLFDGITSFPDQTSPMHGFWPVFYAGAAPTGWFYLEQLNYDRTFQEQLLPAIDVENRRVSPRLAGAAEALTDPTRWTPSGALFKHRAFSALLLPSLPKCIQRAARAQSGVDLAGLGCALERYRLVRGQYPQALDPLFPEFTSKLPHDIVNGQPLHYRPGPDTQYTLYSVGWNEQDDGGKVAVSNGGAVDWNNGDWVWALPDK